MKKHHDPEFRADEYPVIHKMYQLTLTYTQRVTDFPRDKRFVLGDRILKNCYDLLEGLIEARYLSRRVPVLHQSNLRLEKLRFQTRLCRDLKIISIKQYGIICETMEEIGRMIGGWMKASR
jgi:hypothetical protein